MNELTGTITLAYVEEDNRQRMIFRIVPLCTKEGYLFHGTKEDFPDEGSLRIVPDKREQGTFKDRMRSITHLCAISLPADGKEKIKIRQNRNYNPENGEKNQLAIYSDSVCEFMPDSCFEVVEAACPPASAITPKVLLRRDMVLYGPVTLDEAKNVDLSTLKPFGNDSFLLHTIETPATGKCQVYWNPEMLLNWRQHRIGSKQKEKTPVPEKKFLHEEIKPSTEAPQPMQAAPVAKPVEKKPDLPNQKVDSDRLSKKHSELKKPQKDAANQQLPPKRGKEKGLPLREKKETVPTVAEPAPVIVPAIASVEEESETILPIGESLNILDNNISFDQQLDRLAQPLSDNANRLVAKDLDTIPPVLQDDALSNDEELQEPAAFHSNATQLRPDHANLESFPHTPVNVFQVVEQAMRTQKSDDDPACVSNPIANLQDCLDAVWQDSEMREQAISMLADKGELLEALSRRLAKKGLDFHIRAAAEEQLAAITAERIELLMELRVAKEDEKKYRQEVFEKVSQKKRDEIDRLKKELDRLRKEKNHLLADGKALSAQNQELLKVYLAKNVVTLGMVSDTGVTLTPVIGAHYELDTLAENLRINLNNNGFSISEDDVQALLVAFGLSDAICLDAENPADSYYFARVMLDSLGLNNVSSVMHKGSELKLVNLLDAGDKLTPTVSIQPLGTDHLCAQGHKVIYISDSDSFSTDGFSSLLSHPFFYIPPRNKKIASTGNVTLPEPVSISSFGAFSDKQKPLMAEAEKWLTGLQNVLVKNGMDFSANLYTTMSRFIAVASGVLRGGFPVASDIAVSMWLAPIMVKNGMGATALENFADGLGRTISFLKERGKTDD